MLNKIKKAWQTLIQNIAEQNKSTYGEGGLNCCELKDKNGHAPKQS